MYSFGPSIDVIVRSEIYVLLIRILELRMVRMNQSQISVGFKVDMKPLLNLRF